MTYYVWLPLTSTASPFSHSLQVNAETRKALQSLGYSDEMIKKLRPNDIVAVTAYRIKAGSSEQKKFKENDGKEFLVWVARQDF